MRVALVLGALVVAGCTAASAPSSTSPAGASSAGPATGSPAAPTAVAPSNAGGATQPAPTDSPTPAVAGLAFEQVASFEGTELYAATAFAGGFVVGGCRLGPGSDGSAFGGCAEARLLFSGDGRTWSDARLGDPAGRQILGLADTPLGILAFGTTVVDEPPAARSIWRSADGLTWETLSMPAPLPIVFTRAIVLEGRTVLFGSDSTYDFAVETEAWSTTDGRTWTSGTTPMTAKVAGDPGVIAFGTACVDLCPEDFPLSVERSPDGFRWTKDAADPSLAAGEFLALGSWAGRAVAGGALDVGEARTAAVWIDMPGGWQMAELPEGRGYAVETLISMEGRLLAVARSVDEEFGRAWASTDGRAWTRAVLGGVEDQYIAAWAGRRPLVAVAGYSTIWRMGG